MPGKVPRPFSFSWGGGQIVEEAWVETQYTVPAIQLLEYDGDHDGYLSIRFCHFSPRGSFQRSPMMIGKEDLKAMREALKTTPRLRKLLKSLVAD